MAQTSITQFFTKRKRAFESTKNSKILLLDSKLQKNVGKDTTLCSKKAEGKIMSSKVKIVYKESDSFFCSKEENLDEQDVLPHLNRTECNNPENLSSFRNNVVLQEQDNMKQKKVTFHFLGNLSPRKMDTLNEKGTNVKVEDLKKSVDAPEDKNVKNSKDMTIEEIRSQLLRSSKLSELKASLSRFDRGADKLKKIKEKEKDRLQLQQFKNIELEVELSPSKTSFSPVKASTPVKMLTPVKSQTLTLLSPIKSPMKAISRSSSGLSLPYSYRCLAEVFRCVETVVAMLYNRKELVTFKKLKPAVQEMMRRNFTEHHLGQIKKVYPNAYFFHQEKYRSFGSMSKTEKYELTITPILDKNLKGTENSVDLMSPSCLLERKKIFNDSLLQRVKNFHKEFLLSLDPPLEIEMSQLTRWHPAFDLERVAEVEAEELPKPPNVSGKSSAKDVLEKARHLFNCNKRMMDALERVSAAQETTKSVTTEPSEISPALKGIPKALLEKIRAKQAAKALTSMTRTAAEDKEAVKYSRLPELARILRNIFISEKKAVMPLEMALQKLGDSFREKLPIGELEDHLKLLEKLLPGWMEVHEIRKTRYLKLSKHGDMAKVINKLERLAEEKNKV